MPTGYNRTDTTNNIATGNIINASDLDAEYDAIDAAFDETTGHDHGGASGNGAPITKVGPVQDLVVSASTVTPKTTNTLDLGTPLLKFKDLNLAGNALIAGTLGVTGVTTLTAQPILSSLTASRAVFTDASKGLVSNALTGTGNVVMSDSPTLTGTIGAASQTLSGSLTVGTTLGVTGNTTLTGTLIGDNVTDSTSTTTGAIQTDGGLGVAKALWVGGLANIAGAVTLQSTLNVTGVTTLGAGAILNTPASVTLTNATGLPISSGVAGLGTNVATALAVNVGSAGAFVVNGGVLGTPSSGTLTNATGLPISTGVAGLGTGVATALAVNIGSAGAPVVFNGALGTPSSGTVTNLTGTASININGTVGATTANTGAFTTLSYTGTLTGGTGVVNLGSGQFYKDASGNVGIGTSSPSFSGGSRRALTLNAPSGQLSILELGVNGSLAGYFYSNGSETNITSVGATPVTFGANGAERMRIDSAGNVGVGTTSPKAGLDIFVSANINLALTKTGGAYLGFYEGSTHRAGINGLSASDGLMFTTGTGFTERMRIDSSGNVGMGTSSISGRLTVSANNLGDGIVILGNDNANTKLRLTNSGSGGESWQIQVGQQGASNSNLVFYSATAAATRMLIDSTGNVGIGTSSPTCKFQVINPDASWSTTGNMTSGSSFGYNVGGTALNIGGSTGITWIQSAYANNADVPVPLAFVTGATERMRVLTTGNILSLAGGSTTATGTGIAFPATQSASTDANTLDDYEEGTFTPTLLFGGANVGMVYTQQHGNYVKIGKWVTISVYLAIGGKGTSTGNAYIGGLPFTAKNTSGFYPGGSLRCNSASVGISGAIQFYQPFGNNILNLEWLQTGAAVSLTPENFTSPDFCISYSYPTDN